MEPWTHREVRERITRELSACRDNLIAAGLVPRFGSYDTFIEWRNPNNNTTGELFLSFNPVHHCQVGVYLFVRERNVAPKSGMRLVGKAVYGSMYVAELRPILLRLIARVIDATAYCILPAWGDARPADYIPLMPFLDARVDDAANGFTTSAIHAASSASDARHASLRDRR